MNDATDQENAGLPIPESSAVDPGAVDPGTASVAPGSGDDATNTDDADNTGNGEVAAVEVKRDDSEDEGSEDEESDTEGSEDQESDTEGSDNPLETEGEVAADYLEELLDIADLDGDIDTYVEGDRAHVSIVSESEVLVGPHGEVLDALQELTRLAVMTETGDRSRLMLDIAGYRDRRRKELTVLASDAIQEAKDSRDRVALAAMNPFERKIVHDTVAAAGLTSESEGEEPRRHVVVVPV